MRAAYPWRSCYWRWHFLLSGTCGVIDGGNRITRGQYGRLLSNDKVRCCFWTLQFLLTLSLDTSPHGLRSPASKLRLLKWERRLKPWWKYHLSRLNQIWCAYIMPHRTHMWRRMGFTTSFFQRSGTAVPSYTSTLLDSHRDPTGSVTPEDEEDIRGSAGTLFAGMIIFSGIHPALRRNWTGCMDLLAAEDTVSIVYCLIRIGIALLKMECLLRP